MDNGSLTGGDTGVTEYRVGDKCPPLHTRFSSENQPAVRGKRGPSIKTELKEALKFVLKAEPNQLAEGLPEDMTVARKLALNWISRGVVDGDWKAIQAINQEIEGKPSQNVNLGGQGEENPIIQRGELTLKVVHVQAMKEIEE